MLYCTWFATNSQSDLVTTNTVIIYVEKLIRTIQVEGMIYLRVDTIAFRFY